LLGTLVALPGGGNALLLVDSRYWLDDPGDDIWWAIKRSGNAGIADGEWIFPGSVRLTRLDE
jgi:hypothetical protein